MRKNTTFIFALFLLLLGLYSCETTPATEDNTTDTTTETPVTTDNQTDVPPAPSLDYTLEGRRAGDFAIGSPITATAQEKGYTLEERSTMVEGEEEPYYIVSGDGESLLRIVPKYNLETQGYEDAVGQIMVISNRYKMSNGLGVGSTIEEFKAAYADANFLHSNVGQIFIMKTPQLPVQFLLNDADFTGDAKKMKGESTVLNAADFKAGSTVSTVRIF